MADLKSLFRNASLTHVDVLLLAFSAARVAYLSVPLLIKLSTALGNAVEPNKHADIQAVGPSFSLEYFYSQFWRFFCASLIIGYFILARLPSRVRLFTRVGLMLVLLPVFIPMAKRGPRGYFDWLTNPSIRENEAKQKSKKKLQRKLKESGARRIER